MSIQAPSREEIMVVQAVRRWERNASGLAEVMASGRKPVALAKSLHAFVLLIWETDPNAVKVLPLRDSGLTLFELQVLYLVSEHRSGSPAKVHGLLEWWVPESLLDEARSRLSDIVAALDGLDMAFDSRPWVRTRLQTFMENRVKGQTLSARSIPRGPVRSGKRNFITLH